MMAGSDIIRLAESLAIAFTILIVPILAYTMIYLATLGHEVSIIAMFCTASLELFLAYWVTR